MASVSLKLLVLVFQLTLGVSVASNTGTKICKLSVIDTDTEELIDELKPSFPQLIILWCVNTLFWNDKLH